MGLAVAQEHSVSRWIGSLPAPETNYVKLADMPQR